MGIVGVYVLWTLPRYRRRQVGCFGEARDLAFPTCERSKANEGTSTN